MTAQLSVYIVLNLIQTPRARMLAGLGLLALAGLLVYWPALTGAFLFDDDSLVAKSELIHAGDGLFRIWFTTQPLDYWPVTNTSLWLEWRLWGLHSTGYHITNLVLHVLSGALVWTVLRRLAIPGALLGALLFVVHPVNVESVAWIAQRKNTLSMVFFLLSILWYLRADTSAGESTRRPGGQARVVRSDKRASSGGKSTRRPDDERLGGTTDVRPGRRSPASDDGRQFRTTSVLWYWLSLAAFIIAMLSKGSVAALPAVLLLIVWWTRGTISRRDEMNVVPFFAVAMVLTLVNIWFQSHYMAGAAIRNEAPLQRVLGAGAVVWFYLYKAVLPINLTFMYPQWTIRPESVRWWLPLLAAVATTGILLWQRQRPVGRALLLAWAFFCLALVPVTGLTDVYFMKYSPVANHYQYIAILAITTGVGAAMSVILGKTSMRVVAVGAALSVVLGALAWMQSRQYISAEVLYRRTIETNPDAWMAHNNLGLELLQRSPADVQEAFSHLQTALNINPGEAPLHNNVGVALFQMGRYQEAAEQHEQAVRLSPDYLEARANLGADLQRLGRHREAVEAYREALRIAPQLNSIHTAIAMDFLALGRTDEAAAELRQAGTSDAVTAETLGAMGDALLREGHTGEAIAQYREALRRDPASPQLLNNFGYALLAAGQLDDAERLVRQAVRLRPDDATFHDNLGNVLAERGQLTEAVQELRTALRLGAAADLPAIHNDLAIALGKQGHPDEAIAHLRDALRLQPDFAPARTNLARALAEGKD